MAEAAPATVLEVLETGLLLQIQPAGSDALLAEVVVAARIERDFASIGASQLQAPSSLNQPDLTNRHPVNSVRSTSGARSRHRENQLVILATMKPKFEPIALLPCGRERKIGRVDHSAAAARFAEPREVGRKAVAHVDGGRDESAAGQRDAGPATRLWIKVPR